MLDDPTRLSLLFQPVVGLADAVVVGYEALARFDDHPGLRVDQWFAAADVQGRGAELEAVVVRRCLALRASLPPNCFLSLNLSPHLLTDPVLHGPLLAEADLRPLVVELTEHHPIEDLALVVELCGQLRRRGALLALDDMGVGYAGLQQIAQLRPQLIKLDRTLVADSDRDEIKLALAEMVGELADRIDSWLLAEGIETWAELDAMVRLGVPLGQGYLLGRPAPPWSTLDPDTVGRLQATAARAARVEHVAGVVDTVPVAGQDVLPAGQVGLQVDARGHPVALLLPRGGGDGQPDGHRCAPVTLRTAPSTTLVEAARRAMSRPAGSRFDPFVCVDELGRATGVVRIERLLLRLAATSPASTTVVRSGTMEPEQEGPRP